MPRAMKMARLPAVLLSGLHHTVIKGRIVRKLWKKIFCFDIDCTAYEDDRLLLSGLKIIERLQNKTHFWQITILTFIKYSF